MLQCNEQFGGCESIIPDYYKVCPVCGKPLSRDKDSYEMLAQSPKPTPREKEYFSPFAENGEITLSEMTNGD